MNKVDERQIKIMEIINKNKHITINELVDMLGVSHLTIRRDLKTLEETQNITITYGGMIFCKEEFSQFSKRETENEEFKIQIAKKAVKHVKENDIIYIGGGSSCIQFANILSKEKPNININIITSCAGVARITSKMLFSNVTLIDGNFIDENETMVSLFTLDVIENLNFNKAFLGCLGLTAKKGAMFIDLTVAKLKKLVAKNSQQVILLCDYDKIGKQSMATGLNMEDIDIIITNKKAEETKEINNIKKYSVNIELI